MSDLHELIAAVPKGSREEIRVLLTEYKQTKYTDLRLYVALTASSDTAKTPTKTGIAIAFHRLPAVIAGLQAAEARARELGLIEEGEA